MPVEGEKIVKSDGPTTRTSKHGSGKSTGGITSHSANETLAGRVKLPYGPTSFTLGQLRKVVRDVKRKMA